MITTFNNGDLGLVIRGKINAAISLINSLPANYIEKAGTTTPITGYLAVSPTVGSVMGSTSSAGSSGLYLSDNLAALQFGDFVAGRQAIVNLLGGDFYLFSQDFIDGDISLGSETNNQRLFITSTLTGFKGIEGDADYSSFYSPNSFVQKAYTDVTFPKLSAVPGGDLIGTYAAPTVKNSAVISKVLTGLNVIGSSINSSDSLISAFGKLQNQINGVLGGAIYQSTYNASTNSPVLIDGTGTKGYYYVVSVAGVRNLGSGAIDFNVGDWAIYNGAIWQKVDNTDAVSSVNGFIGAVNLTSASVTEVSNLYFTNARAIASTLTGYISGAGAITAADSMLTAIQKLNGNMVTNFVPFTGSANDLNLGAHDITARHHNATGLIKKSISTQNTSGSSYAVDFSASNVIKLTATSNVALTITGVQPGTYDLIIDNTGSYTVTMTTASGWYSNLAVQPNMTGLVWVKAVYDGSKMFITELENMQVI